MGSTTEAKAKESSVSRKPQIWKPRMAVPFSTGFHNNTIKYEYRSSHIYNDDDGDNDNGFSISFSMAFLYKGLSLELP